MESNKSGLVYFFKNRKILIISLLIGGILGAVFSLITPKKYLSTAIIYSANSHVQDVIANPQFGYEVETEQLLQLLESKSMRDKTIKHFNLVDHFEIDTNIVGWQSNLELKYIDAISFFRSKYLSVVINVKTTKPKLSADIANFQVKEIDAYRSSIFENNRNIKFASIEEKYNTHKSKLEELKASIYSKKDNDGALLYNFIENLNNESYDSKQFVTSKELENLVDEYVYENNVFQEVRAQYNSVKKLMDNPMPSVYVIDKAIPTFKKVSPSLILYSGVGAILLFIVSLTGLIFVEKWSELKGEASK